ncbi:sodium p-type [Colletotrichum truncatum]|uniref:Sodium p-type n=1 Tax=Colletotrichum truncatum TaxID=5467 RepID=A0ACC3ZKK3_COLTU|nr:sodium p-type [Colletotrichum truncatum]KAF6800037.1 sodium p-type [Colletotrichum truncatum]
MAAVKEKGSGSFRNQSDEFFDEHISGQSNKPLSRPPHVLEFGQVIEELGVDTTQGLTSEDAARRLVELGRNEFQQKKGVQPLKIFLGQIFNAVTLVLLLALGASFGIQAWIEGGILAGIITLNIIIGFVQTLKAEKTINSLKNLGSPTCKVFRNSKTIEVQTAEVVPGDVINLSTGDSVPADIRLIEAVNLEADEALLTGESAPVSKVPNLTFDDDTGPADRLNVVYSSTVITKGRGRGVVFATGMHTEIGLIAGALNGGSRKNAMTCVKRREDGSTPMSAYMNAGWIMTRNWVGEFLGLNVGTPLQRKLSQLFLWLFLSAIICAIVVMGANKFNPRKDVIIYAVTTSIGTIPVSLLLVLTLTMAAGTKKMVERHVIVRNLSSLEALGGVTNICSDKTGTITQGSMVVRKAWLPGTGTYSIQTTEDVNNPSAGTVQFTEGQPKDTSTEKEKKRDEFTDAIEPHHEPPGKPALEWFLNIASLANLATLKQSDDSSANPSEWKATGAPTEIAIEVFASRFGWNRFQLTQGPQALWKGIAEFPFDSEVKKMSVIFQNLSYNKKYLFTKGAVERVVATCDNITVGTNTRPLTEKDKIDIHLNMEALAGQGLRVLALAHRSLDDSISKSQFEEENTSTDRDTFERNLTFCGLIGIYDPPRPESQPSVKMCQRAGIVVHMLTGDHLQTARAIATEVGILPSLEKYKMLPADMARAMVTSAHEFDALTDAQIDKLPQLPLVVARCAPSTKVRMIEALHRRGQYVGMTGDGVNDSPSLKRADIGIAMGSGSDVAKESADIVLTDDNFASILNAIEEGRRIFDNIQKFILHVLAANVGFVCALLAGLAFKNASGVSVFQLSPVEILIMLLATGAFVETGLGFERADSDILKRPPQNLKYGVFTPEFLIDMIVYGIIMAGCILGCFTIIIFGFYDGNLGVGCNNAFSSSCLPVFRARAATYTAMTWVFVFFAWELIHLRRSLFYMPKGFKVWASHLWSNKFLFFSAIGTFFLVFPALYIPGLDHGVFMHDGITWEWGVVFIDVLVFMVLCETYKWGKRVYFRREGMTADVGFADEEELSA